MGPSSLFKSAVFGALVISVGVQTMAFAQENTKTVRPAYCAGTWYPGERAALEKMVDELLAKAKPPSLSGKPLAIISPHAGYRFSAPVAATAYRCLQGQTYKRAIVMAFSHRSAYSYQGVDAPRDLTAYTTPLGQVPIDRQVCDDLLKKKSFTSNPAIDQGEHSLELQIPLLQRALGGKDFKLVPLYVGRMSEDDLNRAAQAILPWLDDETILVASSDFTHFGASFSYEPFKTDVAKKLHELGDQAAAPLLKADYDGFIEHLEKTGDTICGRGPISLLLRILAMRAGAQGVRTGFETSGDQTGDWSSSVSYQAFVFTRPVGKLDKQARTELLKLARQTVTAYVNGKEPPEADAGKLPAAAQQKGACFVTLQNHGQLRGCIGNMEADGPLCQAVRRNAINACQDYRFMSNPVTPTELDQLDIEISFLTPMQRIKSFDEIIIGRHGLLISYKSGRGVLLPQVAYERGWTRNEFLGEVCRKAGVPMDSWKKPEAELYSFEAEVFGEKE